MQNSLATLYPQHLATVRNTADKALALGGFDHLLIAAGMPGTKFLDDNHYPYAVSPQFKYWLPLISAPGSWILVNSCQREPCSDFTRSSRADPTPERALPHALELEQFHRGEKWHVRRRDLDPDLGRFG